MIIVVAGVQCEQCDCITCGVVFTVPKSMIDHQRKVGGYHHCPNGHSQGWGKGETENDRVRRERDSLRQQLAQRDDEIAAAARELEAERAKALKAKKRASAGVCPCCNRTVSQMARHMKTKHPTFIAETIN